MLDRKVPSGSWLFRLALAAIAVQVLDIAVLSGSRPGPIISQALQAIIAVFVGAACYRASLRSTTFARSFWRLCATAFFVWAVAQMIGTYHLYAAMRQPQVGPRGIMLYFFSFTPLFVSLFLTPRASEHEIPWESYLDFLQILIISGTFYLLFLYAPWWHLTEQQWVSRRATTVNLRNVLLCGGLLLRILTTRSRQYRNLYVRLAAPMSLYSLGFWLGKRGLTFWTIRLGSWFDLGWTLPFLLLVVLAEGWKEQPEEAETERRFGLVPVVLTFLLTLTLPAVAFWLTRYRGYVTDPEVYLICGSAAAAITCFFARLGLTQYRREKTFEKLQASEKRYGALFERNLAGVFRTTTDGRYLDCNEAYARMFGYSSAREVLASNATELYASSPDRARRLDQLRKEKAFTNAEVRLRRKDGTFMWALQNVTLMQDERGEEFIEGTIFDITARKLAEARTLEWKNRYDAAVIASGQIIYDWNPGTNEVVFGGNCERLLGYPAQDIAQKNRWRELIHDEDRARYMKNIETALNESDDEVHLEYRLRKKDGRFAIVRDEGQIVRDESGKVAHVIGFISDVTEQRTLEEQLRQSQKMEAVGRLAGGLAHDFNNLLTVIKGYSRMVLDDPSQVTRVQANVEHIDAAAERAASLTRHLLAFSRKQVLQPEVIDLNLLMTNLDKMLRRLIPENIVIVTNPSAEQGFVNADPSQIEQVIMNLVVNARDAMPQGGKITLETANVELDESYAQDHEGVSAGSYVMLAVTDNGTGMDAETQARIFEPFFTTKELGRGTGLGLSTVYGIVKQSGGHIWVYSEVGRGTTFKIYLARVNAPARAAASIPRAPAKALGNETVLVVEDDELVRDLTRSVLESCGYSVLIAKDGAAVRKICSEHEGKIDLLLTDVVMPNLSGRDVANLITERWPGTRVLYMSGYTEGAIVHEGVLDSDTNFLPKPFSPAGLASKVREVLDGPRDGQT